jgi:hypothetical protein
MSQFARDHEALECAFDDAIALLEKVATGKGYKRAVKRFLDTMPVECEGQCYEYYPPDEMKDGMCEYCKEEAEAEEDDD